MAVAALDLAAFVGFEFGNRIRVDIIRRESKSGAPMSNTKTWEKIFAFH